MCAYFSKTKDGTPEVMKQIVNRFWKKTTKQNKNFESLQCKTRMFCLGSFIFAYARIVVWENFSKGNMSK